jgi:hypothetical protein
MLQNYEVSEHNIPAEGAFIPQGGTLGVFSRRFLEGKVVRQQRSTSRSGKT